MKAGVIDCAEDKNLDTCRAYEIQSFPTVKVNVRQGDAVCIYSIYVLFGMVSYIIFIYILGSERVVHLLFVHLNSCCGGAVISIGSI